MSVLACHPGTGAQLVIDEGQLVHMRASGWMTQAEHDANQAEADAAAAAQDRADAKAEADAEKAASKTPAPAAKTEK